MTLLRRRVSNTSLIVLEKKADKGKWPEFKEKYYNELGADYDKVSMGVE